MRYHKDMQKYPELIAARGRIDKLYLDTTYCHPKHVFPTQVLYYFTTLLKFLMVLTLLLLNFLYCTMSSPRSNNQYSRSETQ